jgi:hypothetical protein
LTNVGLIVAIIHRRIRALVGLYTDSAIFFVRVQVTVAILTGTGVASFCVVANGVLVTIIWVILNTFIHISTLAFPNVVEETRLAFASTLDANRVLKRATVGFDFTFSQFRLQGRLTPSSLTDLRFHDSRVDEYDEQENNRDLHVVFQCFSTKQIRKPRLLFENNLDFAKGERKLICMKVLNFRSIFRIESYKQFFYARSFLKIFSHFSFPIIPKEFSWLLVVLQYCSIHFGANNPIITISKFRTYCYSCFRN